MTKKENGMKVAVLPTNDIKDILISKLLSGWVLLATDTQNMMSEVEHNFYSGDKNKDFEIVVVSTISGLHLIHLGKRSCIPQTVETDRMVLFHDLKLREGEIPIECIGSTSEGITKFVERFLTANNLSEFI